MTETLALVTGASRGIGQAIALTLAKQGYKVVGTATTPKGADSIGAMLSEWGGAGMPLSLDDKKNLSAQLQAIFDQHGQPAVLVNNAGITRDNLMLRMSEHDWDDVIHVNLTGVFHVTQACIKAMVKSRYGRIINITSIVGTMGNPGQANYAAAKAGIAGMTKSLAAEVAKRGITVNAIAPGFIATDMTEVLNDDTVAALTANIPMGRIGVPDDIAHAVSFLASDQANYITGTTLHVNGGMIMV
jgi:3-oxoacyl-[acyl-carrier protein] reductase